MPRLFVAVWPSEAVGEALWALHRKDQRGVRFVPPENWHVTLRFLGECATDDVLAAMDGVELPRARAVLGPAVDVLDERALVVPVRGVDDLARAVVRRTERLGERPSRRFFGHLTVARVKRNVPMPRVLGELIAAEFDVGEVALVQSRLGPAGARYETVHAWPVA
jgi:2'-5' RNA ligase